jgi:hypothetical protein
MGKEKKVTLYAYLDISNPMVAWEVAIGRIKSNSFNNKDGFGLSLWQYRLFQKYAMNGLNKTFLDEIYLEAFRKKYFPQKVSRLQGLYFFESESAAKKALFKWGIPQYLKYISEVSVYYDSVTEYLGENKNNDWFFKYWCGEKLGRIPITEILVSGIGFVENKNLRIEAYKRIYKLFPDSTPLLASAMCGFAILNLNDLALIKPAILANKDELIGKYMIYMSEFETNKEMIAEAVGFCIDHNQFPSIILPQDENAGFNLPDFSEFGFKINNKRLTKDFAENVIEI